MNEVKEPTGAPQGAVAGNGVGNPNGAGSLVQMQDLSKVFLTEEVETHALASVHLEIREGEFVSIAGPSGCGKTTLLSIIGLLDSPSSGEYRLAGEPVANLSASGIR
jgi:putative ABC transport system ATP-binding protein